MVILGEGVLYISVHIHRQYRHYPWVNITHGYHRIEHPDPYLGKPMDSIIHGRGIHG